MTYGLTRGVLGSSSFLEMTEGEYLELVQAKAGLLSVLFLEEKFDLLIENYLEFEGSLLDSTAREMVLRDQDYKWFQLERNLFNRRLVNLLSACRSYVDYAPHHLRTVLPEDDKAIVRIESAFSRHYDARLGYRVMEALRNFVQHRGFPIHVISYPSILVKAEKESQIRFGVSIITKTTYLREDEKFKKSVLVELEALGGRVDLKPLAREYIAALGAVHEDVRGLTQSMIQKWDAQIEGAIRRFKEAFPDEDSALGLAAVHRVGKEDTEVQIFSDFLEYRRALQRKNRTLRGLDERYVTSEVLKANA